MELVLGMELDGEAPVYSVDLLSRHETIDDNVLVVFLQSATRTVHPYAQKTFE